jgi:hypothetical protein
MTSHEAAQENDWSNVIFQGASQLVATDGIQKHPRRDFSDLSKIVN